MSDFNDLIKQIKQIAVDAVNAAGPAGFYEATVISAEPLKVQVDQKLILEKNQLILSRNVTTHEITVDVDWTTEKGTRKLTIQNGLKHGDKVILARVQGGQKYIILDKVV